MTSLRSRLFHGTAVAALALLPNAAHAQALPQGGVVAPGGVVAGTGATLSGDGTAAHPFVNTGVAPGSVNNFTIGTVGAGVAGQSAVVNWGSFDIGATAVGSVTTRNAVNFSGADGLRFSVLNRVNAGGSPTTIAGALTGGGNGTIFVINEAGIGFANSAQVTNLSGLVASSLDIADAAFTTFSSMGAGSIRFTGTGTSAVSVDADVGAAKATIAPDSVLLLVAPKLDIQGGVLSAASGDTGLVLASDATVALNATSIISMKIDAGATVATAQTLAGSIGGKRVLVAAATANDLVGTLLNVTGDLTATTATAGDNGIVIAIGRDAPIDATNSITFTAPSVGPPVVAGARFRGDLAVTGTLLSSTSIETAVSGATSIAAATATGGTARFVSDGALTLGGDVAADGDLTGSGTSVVLGAAGSSRTFGAGGAVALTATGGSITAAGASLITSNSGATAGGSRDVTLSATGAIGDTTNPGFIAVTGGTAADRRALNIAVGAASDLHLGAVTASGLISTGSLTGTLTTTGAITLGATTVTNDLKVATSGTVAIESAASGGNVAVSGSALTFGIAGATRALTAGSTGTVGLTASGGGAAAITTLGDFTISGGGAATLESAPGTAANVSQDGSLAITGSKVLVGNIASNPAAVLVGTGDLVLTANGAATTDSVVAGSVAAQSAINATSAAGTVTLTDATAAGDITVSGTALTFGTTGVTTAVHSTATGGIKLTASGGGAAAVTTLGEVSFSAPGAITFEQSTGVAANVTQNDFFQANGGSVSVGNIALGIGAVATGNGAVNLSASGPAGSGSVVAGTVAALGHVLATSTNADVTLGGATSGTAGAGDHDVKVSAGGVATVSGAVTSTGDYIVTGASVALTGTQAAARNVLIKSTTDGISLGGSLAADTAAAGDRKLILYSAAAITGGSSLTSGTAQDSDILIAAAGDIALGSVEARSLASAASQPIPAAFGDYNATTANVLTGPGAIGLGAVTIAHAVTITASGTTTGHQNVTTGVVTSSNGGVTVTSAAGDATVAGAASGGAAQAVTVTAAGVATVSGAVTSTGDYTVTGASVVLGGAGIVQTAKGDVLIKSTTGNIAAAGTLNADNFGGGSKRLVLDSATSIDANGGSVVNLESGLAGQSDVILRVGAEQALTLGTIDANQLSGATLVAVPVGAVTDYVTTLSGGVPVLSTSGAISLGAVTTAAANAIGTTGAASSLTIGGDTARDPGSSVELSSANGDVTVSGPVSAPTFANLHADRGTLTVGSVSAFGGDARLIGKTAIVKAAGAQTIAAAANVVFGSDGAIGVDAVRGGTIAVGGVIGPDAASLTGDSLRAGGAVTVNTSGAITLTGAHATSAESIGLGLDAATLTTFSNGIFGAADVTLAAGGAVTVNDIASTKNVVGSGTTFTLGTSGATHSIAAAAGAGKVTLTASDTGAAAVIVRGDYAISGGGAVALRHPDASGADVTQNDSLTITGKNVVVGDIALAGTLPSLVGSGDVTLTANGGDVTDAVTAGAVAARNAVTATSATGGVTLGGATSGTAGASPHDVTVTAAQNAAVTGAVTSAGNYTVLGNNVGLGSVAIPTQSAVGDVLIRATNNIFASGTLVADSAGAGNRRLVLAGSGLFTNGGGNVNLRAGVGTPPTAANRSDILLALDLTKNLAFGSVDADAFTGATGPGSATLVSQFTPTLSGGIVTTGQIVGGAIATIQSLRIGSTGTEPGQRDVTLGGVTSATGSVDAFATNGDVALTGPVSAATFANLHADAGTLTAGDVFAFGGDATLTGGAAIAKAGGAHAIAARTDVLLASGGDVTVDAVRAGGTATVRGLGGAGTSAASLTGISLAANGGISVATSKAISLTGSGVTIATPRKAIDLNLLGFNGADVVPNANIALTSTGSGVTVGGLQATGNILISAATTATVAGDVEAGFAGGAGDYVVKGATVSLGGAGTTQKATGNVWIRATGADGVTAAGTLIADDGGVSGIGTGGSRLVVDSGGAIAGGATLVAGAGAVATTLNRSDMVIALADTAQPVTLGGIDARSLSRATPGAATTVADYTPVVANRFETAGAVTFGGVATVASNVIGSTGTADGARDVTVGGDTSASGSVEIRSVAGAVTVTGPVVAATSADLRADFTGASTTQGRLATGSVTARGGNATLTGGTGIATTTASTIAASGDILLASPGAIAIAAAKAGGTISARGLAADSNAASLTGDTLRANGAITVVTTGAITLAGVDATSIATLRNRIDADLGGFAGAPTAPDAAIALTTVAGSIAVNGGSSTGNTTLIAGTGGVSGGVTATGTLTAGDATLAAGPGDIVLDGFGRTSLATATATRTISVTSRGDDAVIGIATAGTAPAGGAITAQTLAAGRTASIASGTTTLGDVKALATAAGGIATITAGTATQGNILADGDAGATITTGTTLGAVATGTVKAHSQSGSATVVTGRARGTILADALTAARVGDGVSVAGDIGATSRSASGGSATITRADARNITADAQFGPATIVDARSLTSGDIAAIVRSGPNLASIGPGTATVVASGGSIAATQLGTGNATIATANASGDVTATAGGLADIASGTAGGSVVASGGSAHIAFGGAGGSVRALASGGTATVDSATAAAGNVDALASGAATITAGTATLGNVRATSTGGGLATITTGVAGSSVIATGGSVTLGSATAGDDIILAGGSGAVTATTLTITGLGPDTAATDASGTLLTGALTGLGGSNAVIRASGAATIGGVVAIAQANAAKSATYDVSGGSVTLGTAAAALAQRTAGRVDIVSTSGDVVFAGTGGTLQSNVGGARTANALADAATAAGGLSIAASGTITGATTSLVANAKTLGLGFDTQTRQPGIVLAAAAGGGGSVRLASVRGGAVTITAPATIAVPAVTATGDVSLTGVAVAGNDRATVVPTAITIDGLGSGFARANVTVSGGAGAEVAAIGVVNGGRVGALQIFADTGAATLRATPADPAAINSILVESQTGVAGILSAVGGPATVAARSIVLRGRQAGSSVLATNPLLATGSVLAVGPTVTLGTVEVTGSAVDGSGDIQVAATGAASLAAGLGESAVARRTIGLTGGTTATLGSGSATGGALGIRGGTVTILRSATAGDDVVVSSTGAVDAAGTTIATTGAVDLQGGADIAPLDFAAATTAAGSGYGAGTTVIADALTAAADATTGAAVTLRGGSNVIVTGGGAVDLGGATLTATGTTARDVRVESGSGITLTNATATRGLYAATTGDFLSTGTLIAGDDLVVVAGGGIDVAAATLRTVGGTLALPDARRADGALLTSVAGGGTLTALGGGNIALAAGGGIRLGAIETAGASPASLRAFAGGAIVTGRAITTSGSTVLVGNTVADTFGLTAGDDIVAVGRGGTVTLGGALTTTGSAASGAALTDLAGSGLALPGEAALGRVDGSSILVASTGLATVSSTVAGAGRYTVYGRGGIALGTAAVAGPGTLQGAARDILLEASIGAVPGPASIGLATNLVLTANSDGVETASETGFVADPLVVRLGNGRLDAGGATLRVLRTAAATLGDQGTVEVQPVVADGVKAIAIATLDSARADLRALNDVTVTGATVDGGLTLASKAGAVSLATLTVGTGVPLMTPAQRAAIDLTLAGATGATLGTATTGANLLRDITVATTAGTASIGTAAARDDIVVASTSGAASAAGLSFVGTASDSEAGVATVAATDANGSALADPYGLTGATITGLAGRNIVVSGATGATLGTVTTAASDSLGDVRVVTAAGPATLTTVGSGGLGVPSRIVVATRNGAATGTTLTASGDIIVDATLGSATLTAGTAGRDAVVVGPTVSIGTLSAGDDIVAVATAGTLNAGTLTSTGANSGDAVATIARAGGTPVVDPVAGGTVGGMTGGNVVALASGDATVGTATASAGTTVAGLVRVGSRTGAATITGGVASGDLSITGATIAAATLSAGRDATVDAGGLATIGRLTAGRDGAITAGSAALGGTTGLIAAQRNLVITTSGPLTVSTARAGATLGVAGGSVIAGSLGAGDALTVRATAGDASVTSATSAGRALLADFSDFASSGSAAGATRDISVAATGAAVLTTGTAVHSISVAGTSATATTATANAGATDGDLSVTATTATATLGTGTARDIRVATTGGGNASATTATASRDLYVDASAGTALLVTGTAGRDAVVVGPAVSIGTLSAGDDIVAVASAGTLVAGTLTSTGANSGDRIATIARANGASIADPVAGGSVGGMTGGNVVALASGDVTVTTATATAAGGATVPGLVRLASLGGTTTTTAATATAGDVVLAGVGVSGGTVTAGRDATVVATSGDIGLGSVSAGRDLLATGANDIVVGGTATAGGNATLTAARDIALGTTATGDALAAAGTATLTSGRDIVVAQRTSAGAALAATAGGAATLSGTASGSTTTLATQGNLTLTADAVATGALGLTSAAAITAPNLTGNGIAITAGGPVAVAGAATSTAALTATGASLAFGSLAAPLDTTLRATGAIGVAGATVAGGALVATSDNGAIRTGAVTSGPATITAADATNGGIVLASLTTTGAATLRAGQSAEVTGAATTSGALTATASNASLRFGSIVAGGAATLRARTALTVGGLARSGGALDALSSAGALSFGSTQATTTLTLRGATGVAVAGGSTAGGAATLTADTGAVTTGDINAAGDVLVTATAGAATLASVSRAAKLTVATATDATIAGAVTTAGDTLITATNGSATVGGAVQTANYTIRANNGTIALGAGVVQASRGTVTLDSQRLTIGAGSALVAPTRIQLDVTGNAAGVSLGDGIGAAAGTTKYALSNDNLRVFQTPVLEIAAVGRSVDIGGINLDNVTAVTGGSAGITNSFGIRTTGDIRIADRLTFTSPTTTGATARVLTLGGAAQDPKIASATAPGGDLDKTTTTANAIKVLGVSKLDNSAAPTSAGSAATTAGGQIDAAGSIVQLRATYIALGETPTPPDVGRPFIDTLLPAGAPLTTAEARTQFVNNAASTLYLATPPYAKQAPGPQALVKAGTLVLAPGQWALIQNTGPTTTPGGGIEAGTLKFNKVAGAAAADPVIAVFGSVAGKTGIASAISVNAANLDGISPNNIRVNGCVALSTAGCIQSAVAIPLINLADPGRTLLISNAPDLALSVELITGATNEALWREDDDGCAPGADKERCAAQAGQQSPQRESRP